MKKQESHSFRCGSVNNNDPITKGDLQALRDFIRQENRDLDNSIDRKIKGIEKDVANLGNKVDNLENRVANLEDKVDNLEDKVDNLEDKVDNLEGKVDNLTDAVVEGFSNTEQILSDWEGKPVDLISQQTKTQLQASKKQKPL